MIKSALVLLSFLFAIMLPAELKAQTWQRMKMELPSGYDRIDTRYARLCFASKNIGWLNTSVHDSVTLMTKAYCLFKTTNGGDNWFVQRNYGIRPLGRMVFALDTNHIWVGLSRSTDGGNTWDDSISTYPKRLDFTEIFFFDSLSGVAVGTIPGTTTDGGKTWTSHDSIPESLYPMKLSFPTRTHGWAACYGYPGVTDVGSIIHTTDGGATWMFQNPPLQRQFFSPMGSVEFLDSLNGFAIGSGEVIVTTNGGDTWVVDSSIPRSGYISFLSDRIGCLSGGYGIFWYTKDRGRTWVSDTTEYKVGFKLFPVSKEGYMFAWGTRSDNNDRELLRGDFRSLTMVEEPRIPIVDPGITINTYPNPFYSSVTMNIHGSTGQNIRISIRDLLGLEVFHENTSIPHSGVYSVNWRPSGNHLSCGSYVVSVSSQRTAVNTILHHMK